MSQLLNRTLKQIGRRLSVNGIDSNIRFSIDPPSFEIEEKCTTDSEVRKLINSVSLSDESGFKQWHNAMRMVARLPGGIPFDFRRKLWLTLADRNIQRRQINWNETCKVCFNETNNPDDEALGTQIVKDLHRTGCSLFNSEELDNQALLKQVLLAYARWNKAVGYCQGFNMLAAIILEVMEGNVSNALKVMIYLIEDVLPESYFANNLRGLSVDMAVFRDLMRLKLSELAKHLDHLQQESYDQTLGVNYEPPLINVFTMQWFLTLFSNCLPKSSVLRIWDLIFLEGNEILLRTALAIWDCLADRILPVESADEFYSIMDVLTREIMEFGITDTNELITIICSMASFPFPRLAELREKYIYNIRPLSSSIFQLKKGFVNMLNNSMQRLIDDDEDEVQNWFDDQFVVVNWCLNSTVSNSSNGKSKNSPMRTSPSSPLNGGNLLESFLRQLQGGNTANGDNNGNTLQVNHGKGGDSRLNSPTMDISLLKKQYLKLKQRQKQAQLILSEGFQCNRMENRSNREQFSMSQLLKGKTALVARKTKKESSINQALPRARFNGKPPRSVYTRSNTITSLLTTVQMPTVKESFNGIKVSDSQPNRCDLLVVQPRDVKRSSSSSTSTELCDEIMGTDYKSDYEYELDSELEQDVPMNIRERKYSRSYQDIRSSSFEQKKIDENLVVTGNGENPNKVNIVEPFSIELKENFVQTVCSLEKFPKNSLEDEDEVFRVDSIKSPTIGNSLIGPNDEPLDDCIRKFQDKILQIKLGQNMP